MEPLEDLVEGGLVGVEDRTHGTVGEQGVDVVPVPLGHFCQLVEISTVVFCVLCQFERLECVVMQSWHYDVGVCTLDSDEETLLKRCLVSLFKIGAVPCSPDVEVDEVSDVIDGCSLLVGCIDLN